MAPLPTVLLFDAEPDLLQAVPAEHQAFVAANVRVPLARFAPGPWDPSALGPAHWGAMVLEGVLAREIEVGGAAAAELLGPGDVLAATADEAGDVLASRSQWTALDALRVALLDEHFHAVVRRWPDVAGAVLARSERRSARLAVAQAIGHLTRVDTRVLLLLWTLADRWGVVTADGLAVPLRLTHRTLGRLVGARRPSVTTAVTALVDQGRLARRDDGSWLLVGPPPNELESLGIERIIARPAPARPPAAAGG